MRDEALRAKSRQLRSELILHWSELTPEDAHGFDVGRDYLIGLLAARYGFPGPPAGPETAWFRDKFAD